MLSQFTKCHSSKERVLHCPLSTNIGFRGQWGLVPGKGTFIGLCGSDDNLFEQVERHCEKNHIFHEKCTAGVQFAPVHYNGQTFLPGQANNFYIFPAVGMAIYATQTKRVTDEMFIEAGQAVADQVPADLLKQGLLYPLQSNILETEIQTAARVAKVVFDADLARVASPTD
ncbi:MAG TPA: malic enzyme-like NAD(P)-binding protein, partial [Candidatus Acidoferrales bacterium]|nr:malic enzyme-like NAD(P)-binding protein [Candidatus Acidoferrales bacterium]